MLQQSDLYYKHKLDTGLIVDSPKQSIRHVPFCIRETLFLYSCKARIIKPHRRKPISRMMKNKVNPKIISAIFALRERAILEG
jgi:hypothetical protein